MFKLVRIDDENHPEIPLLDGKQVIGRCQLFDCDDKRISRNHAELETTIDSVIIKALHTNPCFYVNKNMPGAKKIHQNSTVCGNVGDKIGFLPDKLWFEIRNKNDKPVDMSDIHPLGYLIQTYNILETSKNDNSENVPNGSAVTETKITVKKEINESNVRLDPPGFSSILSTEKAQVLTQLSEQEESTSQTPGKRYLCKEEPVSPFDFKKVKKEENTENDKPECGDSQALHTNPCFYVDKNMPGAKIINQNASPVCGIVGDKIGFLPDKLSFEIRNKDINDDKPVDISDIQPLSNLIQKRNDMLEMSKNDNSVNVPNGSAITETIMVQKELNESNEHLDPPGSPSILSTEKAQVLTQLSEQEESTSQTPGKRYLCKEEPVSPFDFKKVKKEENTENDKPECSDSQASSSGTSTANGDQLTPKKVLPRRERCMYGADCYRKNPQHKAQFSHPSDSDWGSGPRAPCPYGLACARRDPRHWRDHTHPDGMHPPPPPGMKKRNTHIVQRHGKIIYVNANTVNFYDDHFEAEDSDGESVDYDYEFD